MEQSHKLAIVVPYRNRKQHLDEFIPYMKQYLTKVDYKIFIIEQNNTLPFNRGILLNIGFDIAAKRGYDYFVFHDVDSVPLDGDYTFMEGANHLSGKMDRYGDSVPHDKFVGCVLMCDKSTYEATNGFSNKYWGWGHEDDDYYYRMVGKGIQVKRMPWRFKSLDHVRSKQPELVEENRAFLEEVKALYAGGNIAEGLTTLKYELNSEKDIADNAVLCMVNFEQNRQIRTSRLSMLKYNIRHELRKIKKVFIEMRRK